MTSRNRRRSGRPERGTDRVVGPQAPWSLFRNPLPPLELLDEAGLDAIDDTVLRILSELGLEFQNRRAREIAADNGAIVDHETGMVRFPAALIRTLIAKVPETFELHARNPARNLIMGGNYVNFIPVGGPPNVSDIDRGRRPGTYADQCRNPCRRCLGRRSLMVAFANRQHAATPSPSQTIRTETHVDRKRLFPTDFRRRTATFFGPADVHAPAACAAR